MTLFIHGDFISAYRKYNHHVNTLRAVFCLTYPKGDEKRNVVLSQRINLCSQGITLIVKCPTLLVMLSANLYIMDFFLSLKINLIKLSMITRMDWLRNVSKCTFLEYFYIYDVSRTTISGLLLCGQADNYIIIRVLLTQHQIVNLRDSGSYQLPTVWYDGTYQRPTPTSKGYIVPPMTAIIRTMTNVNAPLKISYKMLI